MSFTVAIIGRPNVGKSTLFNRLTGKKLALVDNTPGLTRDRREAEAFIGPLSFTAIDTAGLEKAENKNMEALMMKQTEKAVDDADAVLMLIDGREGVTEMDKHFASWLRKKSKPIVLAVNKCESKKANSGIVESYTLGFGEPVAISAEHGEGMADLYDAISALKENIEEENIEEKSGDILYIAIVGRPNVGKSTLFNCLLGEDRAITSPIAGTTRDSVYVNWKFEGREIRLVDTAGIRKKPKRTADKIESLSVDDSFTAIKYANIVILMIDATEGLDKQDLLLADHIINEGRGILIAANKWDLVKEEKKAMQAIKDRIDISLSQAKDIPVLTLSAKKRGGVKPVIKRAISILDTWNKRISTGKLNRWLEETISRHIPPMSKGGRIKLRYMTQVKTRPPTFALFSTSNTKELPHSYLRYLMNSLRDEFGFAGVPIRIMLRKGKNPFEKNKRV